MDKNSPSDLHHGVPPQGSTIGSYLRVPPQGSTSASHPRVAPQGPTLESQHSVPPQSSTIGSQLKVPTQDSILGFPLSVPPQGPTLCPTIGSRVLSPTVGSWVPLFRYAYIRNLAKACDMVTVKLETDNETIKKDPCCCGTEVTVWNPT